jgi:hypothetical protein
MQRNWMIAAVVFGILAIAIAVIAMRLSDDGEQSARPSGAGHMQLHSS